jgi:hypothetical protein
MKDKIIKRCFDNLNREAYVTYEKSNGTRYTVRFKIVNGVYRSMGRI